MSRARAVFAALGAAALLGCGPAAAPQPEPAFQNLVIVTLDTTRRDAMGFHGREPSITPFLDELAAESMVFEDAFTVAPLTLPAHTSLMTGLYPVRHSVRDNGIFRVPDEAVTLAEILAERGFDCRAEVAAAVLDEIYHLNQGFSHYRAPDRVPDDTALVLAERRAEVVVDAALGELASMRPPFFLWVHLFDPHFPYAAPGTRMPASREEIEASVPRRYAEEIRFADAELRRLFAGLEARGLRPSTLVVFASDHGESLGDAPESSHGYLVHDATMRIPMFVHVPGRQGARIEAPASLVDLVPTLLPLLGIDADQAFDGVDLGPLLESAPPSERVLLLESYTAWLHHGWAPLEAVVDPRWKYVHSRHARLISRSPGQPIGAEESVLEAHPDVARELAVRLEEQFSITGLAARPGGTTTEDRVRLRELGYLVGSDAAPPLVRPDVASLAAVEDRLPELARLNDAMTAMAEQRWEDALAQLRSLAEDNPGSSQFSELYATTLLDHGGDVTAAIEILEKVVDKLPGQAGAHFSLGLCYARKSGDETLEAAARAGWLGRSRAAYRMVLQLDPRHVKALANLAGVLQKEGQQAFLRGDPLAARACIEESAALVDRYLEIVPSGHPDRPRMCDVREYLGERLELLSR
jgi:arylsulfatase A-like enzyme